MRYGIIAMVGALAFACQSKNEANKTKPAPTEPRHSPRAKPSKLPKAASDKLTTAQWRTDLKHLASELPKRHVSAFHTVTKQAFAAAAAKLDSQLGDLKQHQIVAEMTRLVTMIGDGHTQLARSKVPYLQLGLYWFADGVYVRNAPRGHAWAVGRKLTHVNGAPVDQVIAKLTPLIARDNPAQIKNVIPNYLIDATLLYGLGISKHNDRARYTLAGSAGKGRELTVVLGQKIQHPTRPKTVPLYRQRGGSHYWRTYVPKTGVLYLQYNKCANAPQLPFKNFVDAMWKSVGKQRVKRLVIDLRRNGGGDSRVIAPLLNTLAKRPQLTKKGSLFVIIGRRTFSSAVLNTLALKKRFKVILVGEPSGGSPNHYGEVKHFDLPNSKLHVTYATKYFTSADTPGPSIEPDVKVGLTYADYAAGKDPAMAAVLSYK